MVEYRCIRPDFIICTSRVTSERYTHSSLTFSTYRAVPQPSRSAWCRGLWLYAAATPDCLYCVTASIHHANQTDLSGLSTQYPYNNVNSAYQYFEDIITKCYNDSFHLIRISRRRANDKKWITAGLKASSKQKKNIIPTLATN